MSFFKRIRALDKKATTDKVIVVPRIEPGWNINAEEYFRKELAPIAGTEIRVTLQVVDEEDGGWDETNLLFEGAKVGQLPNTYHQRIAPLLRELRSEETRIECAAQVSEDLELKLLVPFPEKLIPFLQGPKTMPVSELQSIEKQSVRLKESDKFQSNLRRVWESADSADWSGSVSCQRYTHSGGKYDGKDGIEVFAEGLQIGSIGPRYVEDLEPIFTALDNRQEIFECRISQSKFDEGKLFGTIFA